MKKILIDSDCGIDDAVAIMIALASPEVDVAGISAVAGNVDIDNVVNNITRLLSYFNRQDVPVFRGASRSLLGERLRAGDVHGKNGFGDVVLPEAERGEDPLGAPGGIYKIARENPGLTIVAIGPLTNIAMAFNLYPDLKDYVNDIVVMGGAINFGNVTKYAEFNFAADPESAQFVINLGVPLTLVPWDAALKALFTEDDINALDFGESKGGRLFMDLQQTPLKFFEKVYGGRVTGQPDPLAMAYVIDSSIASQRIRTNIKMELDNNTMRGASVTCAGSSINVIMEIEKNKFSTILKRIKDLK